MSTRDGRRLPACLAASCLAAAALAAAALAAPPARTASPGGSRLFLPGQVLAETRHYTITARVRPIFFWVARDSIGEARMTWFSGAHGERGYELLVGSDPEKAPRRINQWGYARETEEAGLVHSFYLMTDRPDKDDAAAAQKAERAIDAPQVYRVIEATIAEGRTDASVRHVTLPGGLTFHNVEEAMAQVPRASVHETVVLPARVEPGFLFAATALMHENVEASLRKTRLPVGSRRTYVFGTKTYFATIMTSRFQSQTTIRDRVYSNVIQSELEMRQVSQPRGETIKVDYGTTGDLREVPIRIVYRPNYWFEAELALVDVRR